MKRNKKTKIFLGGFVNITNAQNLNCLALAEYLDKDKYDVYTMYFKKGDFEIKPIAGVKFWKVPMPYRIFKYYIWLKGILVCDILYLPKLELHKYITFWNKIFRKKTIYTVETIYRDYMYKKVIQNNNSITAFTQKIDSFSKVYSITEYMHKYNTKNIGLRSDGILHLGVNTNIFKNSIKKWRLSDIIFIGNNMKYKGIEDYISMAMRFPQLKFHIAGGGGNYNIKEEISKHNLPNIVIHGSLSHDKLCKLLEGVQLMYFPSRLEGFPKVVLECAAAGVPSILYNDYGADEWIISGKNGFVVKDMDEAENTIKYLIENPTSLSELSQGATELGKSYDWNIVIKEWETVIDDLLSK